MSNKPTITEATICYPACKCERHDGSMRFQAQVFAVIDGEEHQVLQYFHDELYFGSTEFIGLNEDQVFDLFMKKDKLYLTS